MKKVMYAFILVLCLGAGLLAGHIIRQRGKAGPALVLAPVATPESAAGEEVTGEEVTGEMTGEGEAGGEMAGEMTGDAGMEGTDLAMEATPEPTPEPVVQEVVAASGRSFAGGADAAPVRSSSGRRSSGSRSTASASSDFSSSSSSFSSGASTSSGSEVPYNQDIGTVGTVIEDPPPTSSSGRKGKSKATPTPVASNDVIPFDSVDDLPTVDTTTTEDPWAVPASTPAPVAAATPDPWASSGGGTEVAMLAPSGSAELVFPGGSPGRASLKKVTQTKRGSETVVKIQMNGSARYRVFRVRNPSRIYIDLEETEVPGGAPSPVRGATQLVKEISAKPIRNAGGLEIARVQILLNSPPDKLPNVSPNGTGEANGSIEIVIGGQESF